MKEDFPQTYRKHYCGWPNLVTHYQFNCVYATCMICNQVLGFRWHKWKDRIKWLFKHP